MPWVIDSSLALAWGLPDKESRLADRFFERVMPRERPWVPPLWWVEVSGALNAARRGGRITQAQHSRLMEVYGRLTLQMDSALDGHAAWRMSSLAREHGLSVYDAAYLELAQRLGAGLASLDKRLKAAARKAGVRVF
ncbi:MAG: type II toxin-antitoxin system VapC family toxin [Elusimicrobiota bacterium]